MRELQNPALLTNYMERYGISSYFSNQNLPFSLYEYAPGELLNFLHPFQDYLKFLVSGEVLAYTLSGDGEAHLLFQGERFVVMDALELSGQESVPYCVEAVTVVRCVELPLGNLRQSLMADPRFLRRLLDHTCNQLAELIRKDMHTHLSVSQRLLAYLRHSPDAAAFRGVDTMAFRLHCSRSQIQRALRQLVEEGAIRKTGKGSYALNPQFPPSTDP